MRAVITGTLKNSGRVCAVLGGSYDSKEQALRWLDHYKALHSDLDYSIEFIG
jgi:hypothetical protein